MKASKHGSKYKITYRCPNFDKTISEYFNSEEEANLRIAQIKLERKLGTLKPPAYLLDPDKDRDLFRQCMTVEQLMNEYLNLYGLNHWSEGTLSCNRHRINDYIIPYIGHLKIQDLTTHRLEQFYRELQTKPAVRLPGHKAEDKTISPSVVEKVHALIRSALNQAIRWDYLRNGNPAMAVELPRYRKNKRDAWTDQEAREALALCTDPILKLCMFLALGCSMRIGEILGLTWDCVHLEEDLRISDDAYLTVNKELRRCDKKSLQELRDKGRDDVFYEFPNWKQTGSTTVLVLKTPKTESSIRNIYIPSVVTEAMLQMKKEQEALKRDLGPEYQDFGIVIAQENGRPFEERMIARKFDDFIREKNLRRVVFHSLRHSSTSLKLKLSGGDIKAVQGDTGHAQANMVTDVYSHIMNDDRKRLARKVNDEFLLPQKEKAPDQPVPNEGMTQLIQMLNASPDLVGPLLQMTQIMGGKIN